MLADALDDGVSAQWSLAMKPKAPKRSCTATWSRGGGSDGWSSSGATPGVLWDLDGMQTVG